AAFTAGKHAPYASYKTDGTGTKDVSSLYLPYDIDLATTSGAAAGWLDNNVTVYFKTINNNLQDNQIPLVAQYYIKVATGGDFSIRFTRDDGTTYTEQYKVVTPTSVWDCTTNEASNIHELKNGHVYKAIFDVNSITQNNNNVNSNYHSVIYTRLRSCSKSGYNSTSKTYDISGDLTEMTTPTDTVVTLPATDSLKPINVNFTQLYELK
ncbi:MAG: hypothetical protein J6Z02_10235, partial [Lachnospiraceae bacterium]|nr:hypothetical protein [Lachnospiraceae bacterium]